MTAQSRSDRLTELELLLRRQMPFPIAAAWYRATLATRGTDRLDALLACFETTLRTLAALLLADSLRESPTERVAACIRKLQRPSTGQWVELIRTVLGHLRTRSDPAPFAPEAVDWYLDSRGRPSAAALLVDRLVERRNAARHGSAPASPAQADERAGRLHADLLELFGSLRWLAGYRPFRVLEQAPTGPRTAAGKVQFLVGSEELCAPEDAEWDAWLMPDRVYIANPRGDELLDLTPFVLVLPHPVTAVEGGFLFDSLPDLRDVRLVHGPTHAVVQRGVPTESGDIAFDAWLARRATRTPWQRNERALPPLALPVPASAAEPRGLPAEASASAVLPVSAPPPAPNRARRDARSPRSVWALILAALAAAGVAVTLGIVFAPGAVGPPEGLPARPRLAILPFEQDAERTTERRLWPYADRMLFNALAAADPEAARLQPVDPLRVEDEIRRREIRLPADEADRRELGRAVAADAVLTARVERQAGEVLVTARLEPTADGPAVPLRGAGTDVFAAVRATADALWAALPPAPPEVPAMPLTRLPRDVGAGWRALLEDPWSEQRYDELARVADGSGPAAFATFARALGAGRGRRPDTDCAGPAGALGAVEPTEVGPLAEAVCAFRRNDYAGAMRAAEAALDDVRLRAAAAAFVAAVGSQVQTNAQRAEFLRWRTQVFPEDYRTWWLLALLSATTDSGDDPRELLLVADALSPTGAVPFPVALNAVRTSMQLLDLARADGWMARLERAEPTSDWDICWRACRKSGLLQLRGRFGDAQRVLAAARAELSARPGDPYTVVATALIYSHLRFNEVDPAEEVLAEYERLFGSSAAPDRWTAALHGLAVRAKRDALPAADVGREATLLGERLRESVGPGGTRERDAFVCLALSSAGSPADARALALQAEPSNTMIAGCRYHSAEVLLAAGRAEEARAAFAAARRDILFRSDWYFELYLPALLGEAQAAEAAGASEDARALHAQIVAQYRDADRDLPEVTSARAALKRLPP